MNEFIAIAMEINYAPIMLTFAKRKKHSIAAAAAAVIVRYPAD